MTITEPTRQPLQDVVNRACSDDKAVSRQAAHEFVAATYFAVLAECRYQTWDEDEATDAAGLAVATLLQPETYRRINNVDDERSLWAWARGFGRWKSRDIRRKRAKVKLHSIDELTVDLADESSVFEPGVQTRIDVRDALARIPANFRDPLILIDVFGYSYKQSARRLGVKETTVTNRLHRARHALRALLEAEGYTHHG